MNKSDVVWVISALAGREGGREHPAFKVHHAVKGPT